MTRLRVISAKIPLILRVVSLYVLTFICVLVYGQIDSILNRMNATSFNSNYGNELIKYGPIVSKKIFDGQPKRLIIERIGIDLPILVGTYDSATDNWTLTDNAVFFANMSRLPNNQDGTTFIYGHNNDTAISSVKNLIPGDIAVIQTENDHTFTYVYTGDTLVVPDLTSSLTEKTSTPRLTIMTCEGIFNDARRLMYFDLKDAI